MADPWHVPTQECEVWESRQPLPQKTARKPWPRGLLVQGWCKKMKRTHEKRLRRQEILPRTDDETERARWKLTEGKASD